MWRGEHLVWKMGGLIVTGGLISFLLNRDAAQIAVASTVAFVAASVTDAIVFHVLRRRGFLVRANGSNVPAAAVDSIVFPASRSAAGTGGSSSACSLRKCSAGSSGR